MWQASPQQRLPAPGCCLGHPLLGMEPSPVVNSCPSQTGGLRLRAVRHAQDGPPRRWKRQKRQSVKADTSASGVPLRLSRESGDVRAAHMQQFAVAAQAVRPVDWWVLLRRES